MRRRTPVVLCHLILSVVCAAAQETAAGQRTPDSATADSPPEVTSFFEVDASEWMVTGGPAIGVVVFNSARGHRYMLQTVSWGRILSAPRGPGALRGQFEWAFEAVPIYGQFAPTDTYGIGFSPLVWRWNFEPRGRVATYGELAGGGLWTTDPVPVRTTTANFTAHAAYGIRYFLRPQQALVLSYRFHHISNGNRLERNPGVNAHVFQVGFSYFRPQKHGPLKHGNTGH
jgi:Lipid A 3-O-deacylase (PagL)